MAFLDVLLNCHFIFISRILGPDFKNKTFQKISQNAKGTGGWCIWHGYSRCILHNYFCQSSGATIWYIGFNNFCSKDQMIIFFSILVRNTGVLTDACQICVATRGWALQAAFGAFFPSLFATLARYGFKYDTNLYFCYKTNRNMDRDLKIVLLILIFLLAYIMQNAKDFYITINMEKMELRDCLNGQQK